MNGGTATAQATIVAPALVSLTLSPQGHTAYATETVAYSATGAYTDASSQDLTSQVQWTSSDPGIATIDSTGLATAQAAGMATITATKGDISSGTFPKVLTPPALGFEPASAIVKMGDSCMRAPKIDHVGT